MPGAVIVFVGPTVPAQDVRRVLPHAHILPPAACGDVLAACESSPLALAIVDGYFDHQLSVWHKEILWALRAGIRVYGAASMGALRAAELAEFGMVGVGQIFGWFVDGTLEDDDEVALIHGPAEVGYRALSDAMVNIRVTLRRAHEAGVISEATSLALIGIAKSLFYPERSFQRIIDIAERDSRLSQVERLREWLPAGAVDQKREDALAMLARVRDDLRRMTEEGPPVRSFHFEYTEAWHELRQQQRARLRNLAESGRREEKSGSGR